MGARQMTPTRALCFVLPALILASMLAPLPGTAGLCWRAELLGFGAVLLIVWLWQRADDFADGNVGGEE